MITIRKHCIPAYDELSRMRSVQAIPEYLESMEEVTAKGIVLKLHTVTESEYFKSLPDQKVIVSGGNQNYEWRKASAKAESDRIWNECKMFL